MFNTKDITYKGNSYKIQNRALLIKDNEISDWILNIKKGQQKQKFGLFDRDKPDKKETYIKELNHIIDKMEMWGE